MLKLRPVYFHLVVAAATILPGGTASGLTLKRVADTTVRVPGSTEYFGSGYQQALDDGKVAFQAVTREAIFTGTPGNLIPVADRNTPMPGYEGTFNFFSSISYPAIDNGTVAFWGQGTNDFQGIYGYSDGRLFRIADQKTTVPATNEVFAGFHQGVSLHDGVAAFTGSAGPFESGVYTSSSQTLSVIADHNTSIPGEPDRRFGRMWDAVVHGGTVAFYAETSDRSRFGVYKSTSGTLSQVFANNATVPGTAGTTFTALHSPAIGSGGIAFGGNAGQLLGLYFATGAQTYRVMDSTMAAPGGVGRFTAPTGPSAVSGRRVAFLASDSSWTFGIYVWDADSQQITCVLRAGDKVHGQTISQLWHLGPQAFQYPYLLLSMTTESGGPGLWLADLNGVITAATDWTLY